MMIKEAAFTRVASFLVEKYPVWQKNIPFA